MKTTTLILLLEIAGLLHLGLMCAGLLMPRAVGLRRHLATLPPFIRNLFWVYYSFIALCLVSVATITLTLAPTLAGGTGLARALCLFMAAFWIAAPLLAVGFTTGIVISLIQVLTSIQDSGFNSIPRLIAFLGGSLALMPWMVHRTMAYATDILGNLSRYAR